MSAELKRKSGDDNESTVNEANDQQQQQQVKKPRVQVRPPNSAILGNDGEWWSLGTPTRFVRISEFKGKKYVDIREYYVDSASGELKPGKKGISLSLEQFKELQSLTDDIQAALK